MIHLAAPPTEPRVTVLSAHDRCDRCPGRAVVLTWFATSSLRFCGHHFARYEDRLRASASVIVDERESR